MCRWHVQGAQHAQQTSTTGERTGTRDARLPNPARRSAPRSTAEQTNGEGHAGRSRGEWLGVVSVLDAAVLSESAGDGLEAWDCEESYESGHLDTAVARARVC